MERLDRIATCLAPLEALSETSPPPSPFFLAVYSQQVYWTDGGRFLQPIFSPEITWHQKFSIDSGYGRQAPPALPGNQIFSYTYVLPYYLRAVRILIAIGTSFFADFGKTAQRQQDALIRFATFLTTIHDLIAGGITKLTPAPPPWADRLGLTMEHSGASSDIPSILTAIPGVIGEFVIIQSPPSLSPSGMVFEYGAVEKFSGFSSIKSNGFKFGPGRSPELFIFQKLQIRALREMIKVYAGVGLLDLCTAINGLKKLAGQAPLSRHKYADWSFREIFAQAGIGARDGYLHLTDLANLILDNPPFASPLSWRNLLEPAG